VLLTVRASCLPEPFLAVDSLRGVLPPAVPAWQPHLAAVRGHGAASADTTVALSCRLVARCADARGQPARDGHPDHGAPDTVIDSTVLQHALASLGGKACVHAHEDVCPCSSALQFAWLHGASQAGPLHTDNAHRSGTGVSLFAVCRARRVPQRARAMQMLLVGSAKVAGRLVERAGANWMTEAGAHARQCTTLQRAPTLRSPAACSRCLDSDRTGARLTCARGGCRRGAADRRRRRRGSGGNRRCQRRRGPLLRPPALQHGLVLPAAAAADHVRRGLQPRDAAVRRPCCCLCLLCAALHLLD
jgi:hypothetical protein